METDNTEQSQGSDFEKVQGFIKDQVKEYFDDLAQQHKFEPATPQQSSVSQQDQARQQLRDMIDPIYRSDVDDAKFAAADARDYVDFYTGDEDATVYKDEVEKTFKMLKDAGRPTTRADVLKWIIGSEYKGNKAKFTEREEAKKQKEMDRVHAASDFGASSAERQKADTDFKSFSQRVATGTSDEISEVVKEMEKAMVGMTF